MNYISDEELKNWGFTGTLSEKAVALAGQQKATWELAAFNYKSLDEVLIRSFGFGHFRIDCQFNPGRIRSSAANTAADAILARPCFLCAGNLPEIQAGIAYGEKFIVLVNPYPIFPCHLTIPHLDHIPQQISGNVDTLIDLSYALSGFTVFYNGPRCGASAPDHLHFQAGLKGSLPVETELEYLLKHHSRLLKNNGPVSIHAVDHYLRRLVCLTSRERDPLVRFTEKVIRCLFQDSTEEPMLNILSWYGESGWKVVIFPRSRQRPWQYFAEGPDKLVISPAAVELGGLTILPRQEDFNKITDRDLASVFSQVTIQDEEFRKLKYEISTNL